MMQDLFDDRVSRKRVGRVSISRRPFASRMKCVPRGACVASSLMSIAVLPESKADSRFRVPNGFETRDEVVFRSLLPSATDDEKPAIEVFNLQIHRGLDVLRVIRDESRPKFVALRPWCRGINRFRVGFANIDRSFRVPYWIIGTKVGPRINRVDTGAIETR